MEESSETKGVVKEFSEETLTWRKVDRVIALGPCKEKHVVD